jgi:hypothetical protein
MESVLWAQVGMVGLDVGLVWARVGLGGGPCVWVLGGLLVVGFMVGGAGLVLGAQVGIMMGWY